MAKLVAYAEDIKANLITLDRFAAGSVAERAFHATRIKNGKLFVVLQRSGRFLFAPSKFAGYLHNNISHEDDLNDRDGRITNRRITQLVGPPLQEGDKTYQRIDGFFLRYCSSYGITPSRHHQARRYWMIEEFVSADELPFNTPINEGAVQQVFVNRYERNEAARRACIAHHGYDCAVCGFNFVVRYGDLGQGYIHVHHLVPLSTIKQEYQVDPVKDLRPVCPNCHAMLHHSDEVLSIDELRKMLSRRLR
jgi:5-methylcytosine-specific restriction enzyme A